MVLFFLKAKDGAVEDFFIGMVKRGVEHGYNTNINALLWTYKKKDDVYCIYYSLFFSFFLINWFFYLMFKLALKLRYKQNCKYVGMTKGIKTFIGL